MIRILADPGQHQHDERVIDHRLVVDRQQLLAGGECQRIQPGACPACENDAPSMSPLLLATLWIRARAMREPRYSAIACAPAKMFVRHHGRWHSPAAQMKPESALSRTWEHYGAHDPYYGVLTAPEFTAAHMTDAALAEFFASGVRKVDQALALAEETFGPVRRNTALDYGSGAGRLTRRLSDLFGKVIAIDVSRSMMQVAARNLADRNVAFEHASEMTGEPVNFILSVLVFQHIHTPEGMKIIPALAKRLQGTGIIDIPIAYTGGITRRLLRLGKRMLDAVRPPARPTIPMYLYDLDKVTALLREAGCQVSVTRFDAPMFTKAWVIFHREKPASPG